MEGHLPAGYSASPSLPPSPSVHLAVPRCVTGSTQDASYFNRTKQCLRTFEKCQGAHVQMNAESPVLPACLQPLAQGCPKLVLLPTPGGREKPGSSQAELGHKCRRNAFPSLIFQDYFTPPNRQPHAITDQKAKVQV